MKIGGLILGVVVVVPVFAVIACGSDSGGTSDPVMPTPTSTSTTPPSGTDGGGTGTDSSVVVDSSTGTDSAVATFTISGTVINAASAGLVLQLNAANDLSVPANATTFSFTAKVADKATYAVTTKTLPTRQGCRVQAGSGSVAGADVTNVVIDCASRTSCKTLHTDIPSLPSGAYLVDPDGAGAIAPLDAQCDMTFNDGAGGGAGGWTMILSTVDTKGPTNLTEGPVLAASAAYLPLATMQAFANAASQVHIRSTGLAATESVTSKANNEAITNLRAGNQTNEGLFGLTPVEQVDRWTGPFAVADRLSFTCATDTIVWPSVYWACGNQVGLHVIGTLSQWNYNNVGSAAENVNMEVYVR